MVLLIGNYAADEQQSMDRVTAMMFSGLTSAGIPARVIRPPMRIGRLWRRGTIGKWLGYIDKFLLFPPQLRSTARRADECVVHICDHSNAIYTRRLRGFRTVVSCHDLLAVRGGLGEQTDCPASATGKILQRWILAGLRSASAVACVSRATLADAQRLIGRGPKLELIPLGLNYPYRVISEAEGRARLQPIAPELCDAPFILHVGSNLRRKNREALLRIFAAAAKRWNGRLVIAGDALTDELRSFAQRLAITPQIVELVRPDNQILEALYNRATALVFPSRFEGLGWPIVEAQACGCPVICSNAPPMSDVAGDAGLLHDITDEQGFAADVLRLTDEAERRRWSARSIANAQRFSTATMIEQYRQLYRSLGYAC